MHHIFLLFTLMNWIERVLKNKCPRCHKGSMFTHSPFNLKYALRMHNFCPVCGQRFHLEPGFYEGALYFNYALNVAIIIISGFSCYYIFHDPDVWVYLVSTILPVLLCTSITSRLSKSLMLHIFGGVKFVPDAENKKLTYNIKIGKE